MADFCKTCSIREFGKDYGDLSGLVEENQVIWTICEGCDNHVRWPFILVNHEGERQEHLELPMDTEGLE